MPNLLHVHLPAHGLHAERSWLGKFNVLASVSRDNCVHVSLNTKKNYILRHMAQAVIPPDTLLLILPTELLQSPW